MGETAATHSIHTSTHTRGRDEMANTDRTTKVQSTKYRSPIHILLLLLHPVSNVRFKEGGDRSIRHAMVTICFCLQLSFPCPAQISVHTRISLSARFWLVVTLSSRARRAPELSPLTTEPATPRQPQICFGPSSGFNPPHGPVTSVLCRKARTPARKAFHTKKHAYRRCAVGMTCMSFFSVSPLKYRVQQSIHNPPHLALHALDPQLILCVCLLFFGCCGQQGERVAPTFCQGALETPRRHQPPQQPRRRGTPVLSIFISTPPWGIRLAYQR